MITDIIFIQLCTKPRGYLRAFNVTFVHHAENLIYRHHNILHACPKNVKLVPKCKIVDFLINRNNWKFDMI